MISTETILALLAAQFQGVRKDGLNQLARSLALTVDTEEKAKEVVGKLTADQVKAFVGDWRKEADAEISKANQTYENGLKAKFDFVEKGKKSEGGGGDPKPSQQGNFDAKAIQEMITNAVSEATKNIQSEVANLQGAAVTANRREALVKALGEDVPKSYREAILEGFEGRAFENEDAFNEYLAKTKENVAAFCQEMADKGLGSHGKPIFGTPDKDGVSAGVASYIKEKADEAGGKGLGGKEV